MRASSGELDFTIRGCDAQFMSGSNYTIFLSFETVIVSPADHRFIHFFCRIPCRDLTEAHAGVHIVPDQSCCRSGARDRSLHLMAPMNINVYKHGFYESQ